MHTNREKSMGTVYSVANFSFSEKSAGDTQQKDDKKNEYELDKWDNDTCSSNKLWASESKSDSELKWENHIAMKNLTVLFEKTLKLVCE